MLLFNLDLLRTDPIGFGILLATVACALVVGVSFHEFSHAAMANIQGDLTATRLGRLTLDPRKHLDRAGSIVFLLFGFGWGKPVPVNPYNLRSGRQGMALVSVAGPAANLILAVAIAMLFRVGLLDPRLVSLDAVRVVGIRAWPSLVAGWAVLLNLILAAFNLLPIPPLDGGGILAGIAPRQAAPIVLQVQKFGPVVLMVLILLSFTTRYDPLGIIFAPVYGFANFLIGR